MASDSNGHTILDVLMLRGLGSHSNAPFKSVDDNLEGARGHVGDEVDICGPWDAELNSCRSLVDRGAVKVPPSWNHKSCHTSVQAICHCIDAPQSHPGSSASGLSLRRCFNYGLKMELHPVHTMVLTAAQLLKNWHGR